MKRRKFVQQSLIALSSIGVLSGLYAWQIEPFWLEFVRLKMPIKNLPPSLEGKTLMQISDIHVGKRFDYNFIIQSFQKAQEYTPDFVVYTGDYVSTHKDKVLFPELNEVMKHAVKGNLATIAILGNHDYGKNFQEASVADKITNTLSAHNIQVLRNESTVVNGLHFIGIDDYWGTNFHPQKAFTSVHTNLPSIALCHNPDVCDLPLWDNFEGWILAGHTHGGQCKPPFLPPPILPVKNKRYTAGIIHLGNQKTVYINRALGHLWQLRFNVRPEITIFELTST